MMYRPRRPSTHSEMKKYIPVKILSFIFRTQNSIRQMTQGNAKARGTENERTHRMEERGE